MNDPNCVQMSQSLGHLVEDSNFKPFEHKFSNFGPVIRQNFFLHMLHMSQSSFP